LPSLEAGNTKPTVERRRRGSSTTMVLDATLGQPFIGPSGGVGVLVGDGYWYGVSDLGHCV
jgi:hypothetical protein